MSLATYVPKAWGHEEILVATELYTLKRLVFLPGFVSSYHYHREKDESFCVIAGELEYVLHPIDPEDEEESTRKALERLTQPGSPIMRMGHKRRFWPWTAHRCRAYSVMPAVVLEVSTRDRPEDTVRLTESGIWTPL